MKRFIGGLTAVIVGIGLFGTTASAQTTSCSEATVITNTGPGSTNVVECLNASQVQAVCTNNVYVGNTNSQTSTSGNATGTGNLGGGTVISGSATNQNGAVVQLGTSCETPVAPTTPDTPTPPNVTPSAQTATPQTATPQTGLGKAGSTPVDAAALPNTASNHVADAIFTGAVSLIGLLGASQLAATLYRHNLIK